MRTDSAEPVRLKDYRPPDYLIDKVDLDVKLDATATKVLARLEIRPNPQGRPDAALILDGDGLRALRIALDGESLNPASNFVSPDQLTIASAPQRPFTLEIETEIDPSANSRLMGLYRSGSAYCTQCEAGGVSPHHLFSRPARRAQRLYGAHRGLEGRSAAAFVEWQPHRSRGSRRRPPFRALARPFPEAQLSVRSGRRRPRLHSR